MNNTSNRNDLTSLLSQLVKEDFCYLTSMGRVSGKPHQIEIWFVTQNNSIYMMAGNHGSDWVKNLRKDPNAQVRIAKNHFSGIARLVSDQAEEMWVRNTMADKYNEREDDGSLSEWAQTALPVAIDLKEGN